MDGPTIDHQYSVIDCVKEEVIEIVLNLKSVVIKGNCGYDTKKFNLPIKKKGVVTAGMIEVSEGFEIVNPNLIICNATNDLDINIEIMIKSGKGYSAATEHKELDGDSGIRSEEANGDGTSGVVVSLLGAIVFANYF